MSTEIIKIKDGAEAVKNALQAERDQKLASYLNSSQAAYTEAIESHNQAQTAQQESETADLSSFDEDFAAATQVMVDAKDFIIQNTDSELKDSIFEVDQFLGNMTTQLTSNYIAFGDEMDAELDALKLKIGTYESVKSSLDAVLGEGWDAAES